MSLPLFRVQLSPNARADLKELREYIALKATPRTAANYIRRLRKFSQKWPSPLTAENNAKT